MNRVIALMFITLVGCKDVSPAKDEVMVAFINKTKQDVKLITLKHEKGVVERGVVGINDTANILFHSPGENSFKTTIVLADGKTLTGQSMYVEHGYELTATIYDDSVKVKYD